MPYLPQAVSGFAAFADFLAAQLLFGLTVLMSAWLLLRFIDYLTSRMIAENVPETADRPDGTETGTNHQSRIILAGIIKLAIYVVAGVLLLLPWGYRTSDFFDVVRSIFFGFEIGGLSISIYTLLLALILFFLGYLATVALRNWLKDRLLPTTPFRHRYQQLNLDGIRICRVSAGSTAGDQRCRL